MKIKAFKNGNFNVKADETGRELLYDLVNSIELDFTIVGDEGCASNYEMYYPLYNFHTGMLYLVLGQDCENYKQGKTVKIVGRELDEDVIEMLKAENILID